MFSFLFLLLFLLLFLFLILLLLFLLWVMMAFPFREYIKSNMLLFLCTTPNLHAYRAKRYLTTGRVLCVYIISSYSYYGNNIF